MSQVEVVQQTKPEQVETKPEHKETVEVPEERNEETDISEDESSDSERSELWEEKMLREKKEEIEHWKTKLNVIGKDDVKQIISTTTIPSDKEYFSDYNPINITDCPFNIRRIKNYLEEWKGRTNGIDKSRTNLEISERGELENQILNTCNSIKWLEDFIQNANVKANINEFKFKVYPQLLKVKRILINLYKTYNKVDCARFLKNHKVTYKYGNKKYEETKPKKNN